MKNHIALWLMPHPKQKAYFQKIVSILAKRYQGPLFEPHITLYAGDTENLQEIADHLTSFTQEIKTFRLRPHEIKQTSLYTKALYITFYNNPSINNISNSLKKTILFSYSYRFEPHLSLMYTSNPLSNDVVKSIKIPKEPISFDTIKLIDLSPKTETKKDVESWKEMRTYPLKS